MSDETPETHEQVDALLSKAPPKESVEALVNGLKTHVEEHHHKFSGWDPRLWFAIALVIFLGVVFIAMVDSYRDEYESKEAVEQLEESAKCRSVVQGQLDIARARAVLVNTEVNSLILRILEQLFLDQAIDENEIIGQIADLRVRVQDIYGDNIVAIENQLNILELCK
jgi:hypothetical protein